jgi:hypothetical protein
MPKLITLPSCFLPNLEERDEESAMINRESGLASNPLVETALKAIADWVSRYHNAIGFNTEFGMCGPDEVMRTHLQFRRYP